MDGVVVDGVSLSSKSDVLRYSLLYFRYLAQLRQRWL